MKNLPDDILYLIFTYSINNLDSLTSHIVLMPNKKNLLNRFKNKNIVEKSSFRYCLCNYIQNNNLDKLAILLNSFNFSITSREFDDICKYSSREIIATILKHNKSKLDIVSAIYQASTTFNNKTLEFLYLSL